MCRRAKILISRKREKERKKERTKEREKERKKERTKEREKERDRADNKNLCKARVAQLVFYIYKRLRPRKKNPQQKKRKSRRNFL
jgi:hypothetical protein